MGSAAAREKEEDDEGTPTLRSAAVRIAPLRAGQYAKFRRGQTGLTTRRDEKLLIPESTALSSASR